jgi:hypothetical protein
LGIQIITLGLRPRGYNFEFPRTIFCHNTTL